MAVLGQASRVQAQLREHADRQPLDVKVSLDPVQEQGDSRSGAAVSGATREIETPQHELSLSFQSWEFDELTSDVIDVTTGAVLGEVDIEDVERDLLRIRYRFGSTDIGIHVDLFSEEFTVPSFLSDVDFDLFGLGVGIDGRPVVAPFEKGGIFVDYLLNTSFHYGDGDVPLIDQSGNVVGRIDQDIYYGEVIPQFGVGFTRNGFEAAAGYVGSFLYGQCRFPRFLTGPAAGLADLIDLRGPPGMALSAEVGSIASRLRG